MPDILWRGYRDDDTTYDNLVGPWTDCPRHGWICFKVWDPTDGGYYTVHGYAPLEGDGKDNQFFVKPLSNDEPYPTHDLAPFLERHLDGMSRDDAYAAGHIKDGVQLGQEAWKRICQVAFDDPDCPNHDAPRRRLQDYKAADDPAAYAARLRSLADTYDPP